MKAPSIIFSGSTRGKDFTELSTEEFATKLFVAFGDGTKPSKKTLKLVCNRVK